MTIPGFSAATSLIAASQQYREGLTDQGGPARVLAQLVRGLRPNIRTSPFGQFTIGGSAGFACSGIACTCSGDVDCNDMYTTGVCGDIGVCDENGCWCLRV